MEGFLKVNVAPSSDTSRWHLAINTSATTSTTLTKGPPGPAATMVLNSKNSTINVRRDASMKYWSVLCISS